MEQLNSYKKQAEKVISAWKEKNNKLKKKNKELKESNEQLQLHRSSQAKEICNLARSHDRMTKEINELEKKLDSVRQINIMCMKFMKEIKTEQNLAEMVGLGKDLGTDIAICHIAKEYIDSKSN